MITMASIQLLEFVIPTTATASAPEPKICMVFVSTCVIVLACVMV